MSVAIEQPPPRLEPLPDCAWDALGAIGVSRDEVTFAALADRLPDGRYGLVFLFVTALELIVISGTDTGRKVLTFAMPPSKKKKRKKKADEEGPRKPKPIKVANFAQESVQRFPLEGFDKIETLDIVSGGILALTMGDKGHTLALFTNVRRGVLHKFTRLIGKVKEGKTLEDKDFANDRDKREKNCPKCGTPYPEGRRICPRCTDMRSISRRLLGYLPKYKWRVGLVVLCMAATSLLGLLSPYMSGKVLFDDVLREGGRYYGQVIPIIGLMILTNAMQIGLNVFYGRINAGLVSDIAYDLRMNIFAAMQRLSLSFFARQETGRLMTRVNNDPVHIEYFFHDGVPMLMVNAVTLIGVLIMAFAMNWKLALISIIPMPFIYLFMKVLFPILERKWRKRYIRSSSLNRHINDTIQGTRVVKAFGRENTEVGRFDRRNKALLDQDIDLGNTVRTAFPFFGLLITFSSILIWYIGGRDVLSGTGFQFGELVTFTGLFSMLIYPMEVLIEIPSWYSSCLSAAQRMFEVIDAQPEVPVPLAPVALPDMQGAVEMSGVTFAYEPGKPILKDISFSIPAGHMLGIVGKSGAGKTTLINLLQRLYDVNEGSVTVDGVDVRDIAPGDMRGQIGVVSQETYVFRGTIAENIAYANPDCEREEIVRAAKTAGAHDFIMKTPEGYDTTVGHGGRSLSGGERQRLSIARAILHRPRILILDEATSAVDTATEKVIQEAIEALSEGRTVLSIAHRLSTLRNAHSLIVIEDGAIVESGTHAELLAIKDGAYSKLVKAQSEALALRGVENLAE